MLLMNPRVQKNKKSETNTFIRKIPWFRNFAIVYFCTAFGVRLIAKTCQDMKINLVDHIIGQKLFLAFA